MLNELFEKGKKFVSDNKATLVKVGAAALGAVIGAVVVTILVSDEGLEAAAGTPEEWENVEDHNIDLADETDSE